MNSGNSHLVEPGVRYFLKESLKNCNQVRNQRYMIYYNLAGFVLLVGIMTAILWFMYKGKLTPIEKALRERKKHEYILEKLKSIPQKQPQTIITNLPKWNE